MMASFVFTPSTVEIWSRYVRRKFGQKVEEPLKLQKHKVIAQAFMKRKEFKNRGQVSISFHNSHTDPLGLNFEMNSVAGSHDFSSTWANNLPHFVSRRHALTGWVSSSSHGHRRNSVDSEISFSLRHVSVESRRNSNDSQVSVKIAELKTKVASRSRGSKSKSRSSRQNRRDFSSRRFSRKESSTSMESQIVAIAQRSAHHSAATTAEVGTKMLVPVGPNRRSGISAMDPEQLNELIARNRFLLPLITTSEDDKSSLGSFHVQDSKLDEFLKQIGMPDHKNAQNKFDHVEKDDIEMQVRKSNMLDLSDISSKENLAAAGRNSKNSNRSIASKKSFKAGHNSRLRKTRKSSRSIAKTANPLSITNGSGRIKLDKKSDKDKKSKEREKYFNSQDETLHSMAINGNRKDSSSGQSDISIQFDLDDDDEFAEQIMNQEQDDDELPESHKLLPKRISLSSGVKRRDTNEISLTESEKLKLLLLPSK